MAKGDPRMDDERKADTTDLCLWVDTDVMLADPLTKKMDAKKLWEAIDSNYWDMKQPIESLRRKKIKQVQRRKTDLYTDERKREMKAGWTAHVRRMKTDRYVTTLGIDGGPSWDDVVWREIFDVEAGMILEDKPKDLITKRDLHKTLGKRMTLKITFYTDTKRGDDSEWPERGSELGDLPEEGILPEDHDNGPGPS